MKLLIILAVIALLPLALLSIFLCLKLVVKFVCFIREIVDEVHKLIDETDIKKK